MITPTTFFLLVLGTIGSLQIFDIFYVMTQGGPNFATTSLVMYIFQNAFEYLEMGYASAVAWVLFFIILETFTAVVLLASAPDLNMCESLIKGTVSTVLFSSFLLTRELVHSFADHLAPFPWAPMV